MAFSEYPSFVLDTRGLSFFQKISIHYLLSATLPSLVKMISKKTIKLFSVWLHISRKCGATTLSFNDNTKVLQYEDNFSWRMWANFCLFTIWIQVTLFIMGRSYLDGDIQRFNVAWVYLFAEVILGIWYSIENMKPHDCLQLYNTTFAFMRDIQGKKKYLEQTKKYLFFL